MHITKEAMNFFLYETHLLQKTIAFADIIEVSGIDEKTKINIDNNLNELFLFRVLRDPGLQQFVLESICLDKRIINTTQKYITKLFCDFTDNIADFYMPIEMSDEKDNKDLDKIISNQVDYYKVDFTTFITDIDHSNSIKFYQYLQKQASEEQNDIALTAIQTIINFLVNYNGFGKMPFIENKEHIQKSFNKKRDQQSQLYIYRNLKFSDYYINPERKDYELLLLRGVSFQKNMRDNIAKNFEIPIFEHPWTEKSTFLNFGPYEQHEFIRYIRFTNDTLFIAAEFWFSNKTEQEKLAILNKEYPFEINDTNLSSISIEEIDAYANVLCDMGYYDYALRFFNHCLNRAMSDIDRFFFFDSIAYCYKNLEDYSNAKSQYEVTYKIISKYIDDNDKIYNLPFDISKSKYSAQYLMLLEKKYIAEMDYHLGNEIEANERMSEVLIDIEMLNDEEKIILLNEISIAYHNTFHPHEEYKILYKIIDETNIDAKFWNDVDQRLTRLDKFVNLPKEHRSEKFENLVQLEKMVNLIPKDESTFNSFQFTRALKIIENIYNLNSKASPWEKEPILLAMAYFKVRNYKMAINHFEQYHRENNHPDQFVTHYAGYLGICMIFEGMEKDGLNSLCCEIASFSTLFNNRELGQAIGTLLNHVIKELFLKEKEDITKIIDALTPEIEKYLPIEDSTFYITSAYISICWYEKAIETVDRLIREKNIDDDFLALLIFRKGDLYSDACDFDAALSCYQEAENSYFYSLPTPDRAKLMQNMAIAYMEKMNLIEARKCLDAASKITPENTDIQKLKEEIGVFLDKRLSLESIKCRPARFSLKTAEREALDLYRNIGEDEEFDFSPPLGYYGKGLDILLNEEVWSDIRENIFEKFTDDYGGICAKYSTDLPFFLKDPLNKNPKYRKSISLGVWIKIDVDKNNGHPIIDFIINSIKEKFGKKYKIIKDACKFLAPKRNDVFHKSIKGKQEMLELRSKVIQHLNAVIELIYGSESMEYYNQTFKRHHGDVVLFDEANEYIENGNDDKAFESLSEALKIDPTNSDVLVAMAQISIRRKEFDDAKQYIDKALSIDKNDYDALHEKGVLLFEQRVYDVAAECFQDTIRIKPDHEYAWLNLGCAFMEMFDHTMALPCLDEVYSLNPDNKHLKKEYDFCTNAIQSAKKSLSDINNKIRSQKKDGTLYFGKGFMLYILGKYSDALQSFNISLELGENGAEVYFFKGQSLLRLNRIEEADESFKQSNKLNEGNKL